MIKTIKNQQTIEGVLIKNLERHNDERGFFEELVRKTDDFFSEGFGQLSHSYMHKGVVKAWHYHITQTDWWYVARGVLHVALYDMRKKSSTFQLINEFEAGEGFSNIIIKIPPMVAHGCKVISSDAELFYITSRIYDTREEGRIEYNDKSIGYDWNKIHFL